MKWDKPLDAFYIVLLMLCTVKFSNNASLDIQDKYKKFTGDEGLYNQKDDVEILTADNFKDAIIGSKRAWLVEFYNSWCGFCQRFAPSWKEFATQIREWRDLVVVAALDCANEKNNHLCRDYEIMAYPTLRYYHEGFQEDPKNYGFVMNRGVTAKDHRQELVNKLISEQKEGRGKQFPDLLPFSNPNIDNIFNGAPSDIKYAILVIHEPGSTLGPELVLDFHRTAVIIKYAYSNNTNLINSLPKGTLPSIYIIGQDKTPQLLMSRSLEKQGIVETIKENLKEKNILHSIEEISDKGVDQYEKKKDVDALMEKVKKMGDVVFQMDLETALRYSLKREVGGSKEITGEKLAALRKYLDVLSKYFPFGKNGKALLREISMYAESEDNIQGAKIAKLVKDAEEDDKLVFSTPQKWLGCQGSSPQYRGYPCGLWKMFHYLTVNVADYEVGLRGNNPRLALEVMHGYIKNFFGCADCSQHFQDMAARREINKVASFDDSILWLWMAHNEVNKRLSGDETEDPEAPKIQFPSEAKCPQCHKSDGSWDISEVLTYLKHMYSSVNIRYLGADTKVIYLGLEGNNSTAHAGLQEEAVQIQTRSFGKGLTVGTTSDSSSSGPTTKDKKNITLPLFFIVLTIFYVK